MIRDKFQSPLPRLVSPTLELICALVWGTVCGAQEPYLERGDRVNGWKTRQGFEALYQDHRASVVEILDGGHQVALGTVVSDSGHIITKASELGSDLEIRDHQGQRHVPFSIQVDPEIDLAILQIRSSSLHPVRWGDDSQVAMGLWVMAPHEDESQVRVGVISTSAREVKRKPGALGIVFFSDRGSVTRLLQPSGQGSTGWLKVVPLTKLGSRREMSLCRSTASRSSDPRR